MMLVLDRNLNHIANAGIDGALIKLTMNISNTNSTGEQDD